MKRWIWFFLWMNGCVNGQLPAPKLHLVIACASEDAVLGSGFYLNLQRVQQLGDSIAQHTGLIINKLYFTKQQFHADTIRKVLNNLTVGTSDVIWFHYSGHGIHQDWAGKYPVFLMPQGKQPLATCQVRDQLIAKKPRLLWLMTDCCNHFADGRDATPQASFQLPKSTAFGTHSPSPQDYKQLFLKSKGVVTITASHSGQIAYTHEAVGGILTTMLTYMLPQACQKKATSGTGWQLFLQEVSRNTQETALIYDKYQIPFFEVQLQNHDN
jgi:hypothetical protein